MQQVQGFQPTRQAVDHFRKLVALVRPPDVDIPTTVQRDWFSYELTRREVSAELCEETRQWLGRQGQAQKTPLAMGFGPFTQSLYQADWQVAGTNVFGRVAVKKASSEDGQARLAMEGFYAQWAARGHVSPTVRVNDTQDGYLAIDFLEGGRLDPMKLADADTRQQLCSLFAK